MKNLHRHSWLFVLLACSTAACDDDTPTAPVPIDEGEVLVTYLETNSNYNVHGGFVIKPSDVRTNVVTGANQYVVDIRSAADYATGHIEGAVNVAWADLADHLAGLAPGADSYEVIVLACYSGQTAAFATGVLRAMGHENVKSMKWGMSGWHDDFSTPWMNGRSNMRATQFVTGSSPAMPTAGDYPTLNTGFSDGASILSSRVNTVLAEGFAPAKVTNAQLFTDLNAYYIVNYWPPDLYANTGHVPGAVNYDPATTPFLSSSFLATLPTDQPIALYCYTGQTSAYLTGYLRVLGYDARSLLYGANGMIYDKMLDEGVANAFVPANEIHNYDYVN